MTNLYLGDLAVQEGHFAAALKYLRVAQKGQFDLPQIHLLLGNCYRAQHNAEASARELAEYESLSRSLDKKQESRRLSRMCVPTRFFK